MWSAKFRGKLIVSRETPHPEDGNWEGEEGKLILKVNA